MRNRNQNDNRTTGSSAALMQFDPFRAREQAHYLRQVEMARFLSHAFRKVIGTVVAWHRRNTLSYELNGKPDYLLRDMGLSRAEIPAVIAGELGRRTLALSPTGDQSAPAFYGNENDRDDHDDATPLAA